MNKLNPSESEAFMTDILYKKTVIDKCRFVYRNQEVYLEEVNGSNITLSKSSFRGEDIFVQQLIELNLKEDEFKNIFRYVFSSFTSWSSQGTYQPFLCRCDFSFNFDRQLCEKKDKDLKFTYKLMFCFFILSVIYGLACL